ncbi:GDP-mannose 4,6-dehydratase [Tundrisphaera sp. TA3]|uniref:GDP-mannose 4,6-dehydratase n=1 Tax=Tundrisphaera sp. TA3 TaxID=3435775 RepID=UPI003EB7ACE9
MRALVTGISGFVGGHLAEHLVRHEDQVVGLSASGRWPDDLAHLSGKIRIEPCDLAAISVEAMTDLLARKQPEVIYHLAAQANPQASVADPRGTWALNLGGALTLLESVKAAGLRTRVVLVGSGVCYGNPTPEQMPVSESCPLRPNNPYSASKGAADLLGVQHFLAHGTDVVMARPFNHAGPRQSSKYVLGGLARQVAEVEAGIAPRVEVGNLDIVRDFADVRDVVRGYHLLATRGDAGEIYNLGSGRGTRLSDALEILRGLATVPIEVHVDPARVRPVDQPLLVADASKLRAATGWEPRFSIEQTLEDMLDGWRQALRSSPQ